MDSLQTVWTPLHFSVTSKRKKNDYSKNHPSSNSPLNTTSFCHHRRYPAVSFIYQGHLNVGLLQEAYLFKFVWKVCTQSHLSVFSTAQMGYTKLAHLRLLPPSPQLCPLHPRTRFLPHWDTKSNNGKQIRTMASPSISKPGQNSAIYTKPLPQTRFQNFWGNTSLLALNISFLLKREGTSSTWTPSRELQNCSLKLK